MTSTNDFFDKRDRINLDLTFRCALECPRCLRSYYKNAGMKIPGEDLSLDIKQKLAIRQELNQKGDLFETQDFSLQGIF